MKLGKTTGVQEAKKISKSPFFNTKQSNEKEPFFQPSRSHNKVDNSIQRVMREDYPWDGYIETKWSAALRGAPSHTNFLANLPKGTPVRVTGNQDNWLYLKAYLNGEELTGYVSQELVRHQDSRKEDASKFNSYPKVKSSSGWLMGKKGIQIAVARNLAELGMASLGNAEIVYLKGDLLRKVKEDPDMIAKEVALINKIKKDERYQKQPFYATGSFLVGFGGQRWTASDEEWGSMSDKNPLAHGETWDVAANELTWALRNATVRYWTEVSLDGTIKVTYHLNDRLDLSGSKGRSEAYNNISNALGFVYHDLLGGNINLQTRAEWDTEY